MEIDRKELKRHAREAMRLTKPPFWVVTLVFLLMTTGISLLLNMISFPTNKSGFSTVGMFVSILFTMYSVVVTFGYDLWSLWTSRKLDPGLGSLTQGFTVTFRVIVMEANIYIRVLAWSMVISLALSLTLIPMMGPLGTITALVLMGAAMVAIYLRYALAPYLLADNPDAGPGRAIARSVELMRYWKGQLLKLEVSFIGWDLINVALTGIVVLFFMNQFNMLDLSYLNSLTDLQYAYATMQASTLASLCSALVTLPLNLWLKPYRSVTRAAFYDARLKAQRESAPTL